MDQEKIGAFIAETRKRLNMTQRELGEKVGVSDKAISKWECGKGLPEISSLSPLCEALGLSVNELLSGEELSETEYSVKAEENMMNLMKENEETKKKTLAGTLIGWCLLIVAVLFVVAFSASGWYSLVFYIDLPTLLFLILMCGACVLISGARSRGAVYRIIQKIILPSGILVVMMSLVQVLISLDTPETLGPNLAICFLAPIYALLIWFVVTLLLLREQGKAGGSEEA